MADKQKIRDFLNSDREDYGKFLNEELPEKTVSSRETITNSDKKKELDTEYEDMNQDKWWMPAGLFGEIVDQPPYQELDFETFSFSVMKNLAQDEDIIDIVETLDQFPRGERRKKLRIQLFEALRKIDSTYFNIELYYNVREHMIEANNVVQEEVEKQGYEVISKGFDNHSFLAPDSEAEKIMEKVNRKLDIAQVSREKYLSAISFYNIGMFQDTDGEWFMVKTGGTDYDEIKENVAEALTEKNWGEAYSAIQEGQDKMMKEVRSKGEGDLRKQIDNIKSNCQNYMSQLREIQYSEDFRESEEDIQEKIKNYTNRSKEEEA